MLQRVVTWILALVVGVFFGAAATVMHATVMWGWLPAGIVVGSLGCAGLLVALRALFDDRILALAAGAGLLGIMLVMSNRGPGGSVVMPATPLAQIWQFVLLGIVVLAVLWPDVSRSRARSGR